MLDIVGRVEGANDNVGTLPCAPEQKTEKNKTNKQTNTDETGETMLQGARDRRGARRVHHVHPHQEPGGEDRSGKL